MYAKLRVRLRYFMTRLQPVRITVTHIVQSSVPSPKRRSSRMSLLSDMDIAASSLLDLAKTASAQARAQTQAHSDSAVGKIKRDRDEEPLAPRKVF